MSKKYLYAVYLNDCMVCFPDEDVPYAMDLLIVDNDVSAVYTSRKAAEKYRDTMQRLYPNSKYVVKKFLPPKG